MNILHGIRQAVVDYARKNLNSPGYVYMNSKMYFALKAESGVPSDYEKRCVPQVDGMVIVINDELPNGVVVVGGIVHDCRTDDDTGVKPKYSKETNIWYCGHCDTRITWSFHGQNHGEPLYKWAYCKNCGKRIDWDCVKGRT